MDDFEKFILVIVGGFIVFIIAVAFVEYQFDERNAELFNECVAVADTNEKLVSCVSQYGHN